MEGKMVNGREAAAMGQAALLWLAGRDEEMGVFLGASGLAPEELRARASDPELLGFVLDFLLTDDARVTAFCDAEGLPYEAPMRARAALPGGDLPNWT